MRPAASKCPAIASPIPELAPVTTATSSMPSAARSAASLASAMDRWYKFRTIRTDIKISMKWARIGKESGAGADDRQPLKALAITGVIAGGLLFDQTSSSGGRRSPNIALWALFFTGCARAAEERLSLSVVCSTRRLVRSFCRWCGAFTSTGSPTSAVRSAGHALLFMLAAYSPATCGTGSLFVPLAARRRVPACGTGLGTLDALLLRCPAVPALGRASSSIRDVVLSLAMEIYGTCRQLEWPKKRLARVHHRQPAARRRAFNCMLDMLVVATVAGWSRSAARVSARHYARP